MRLLTGLWDTHAHLDDPDADQAEILRQIDELPDLLGTVVAGYGPERFVASRALVAARPGRIQRTLGLHPWWLADRNPLDREQGWRLLLAELELEPKLGCTVAVGEIGLDRQLKLRLPLDEQIAWFERGLRLAGEVGLPVVLHVVGWYGHALEVLRRVGAPHGGVVHRWSGPPELVPEFERVGLHVAFALEPRENPDKRRACVRAVSPERLQIETDWPFAGLTYPQAWVAMVNLLERMAQWREEPAEALAERLAANARTLYRIRPTSAA